MHSPPPSQLRKAPRTLATPGIFLRSGLFLLSLLLLTLVCLPLMPFLLGPRALVRAGFHAWLKVGLWLLRTICGTTYVVRGREHVPDGPVLFAAKHQSGWDSAVLPMLLGDPVAVVKREFMLVPVMGWVAWAMGHVFVDRSQGARAFADLLRVLRQRVREGRSILIFPEGTRKSVRPYAVPDYQKGVAALYQSLNVPCVPVALNSGLFWAHGSFLRFPGTIEVEILPALAPGLSRDIFFDALVATIETRSRQLAGCEA